MRQTIIIFLLVPLCVMAGVEKKVDPWKQMEYFVGKWEGTGDSMGGISKCERVYNWTLQNKFIQHTNKSVFKPQEKNPKGEVHEDMGVFSYDKIRGTFVFRQFHAEGYVNQYTVSFSEDGKTVTMESEAVENLPKGFRVRYVITIVDDNQFKESFELAGPGKEFACFNTNLMKRIR